MKREEPENEAQDPMFAATLQGPAEGPGKESGRVRRRRQARPTRPRSPGRLKLTVLGMAVAGIALVPLYGDPRSTPLTHPLWARMLLRALDLSDAVRVSATASQAFSTLSWRDSLFLPADRYIRASGVVDHEGSLTATEGVGEVAYAVAVVQVGDYRLRGRMAGNPEFPAVVEFAPMGGGGVVEELRMFPATSSGWVAGGSAHLDPGAYVLSMWLPPGTSLEVLEVAPPCVSPIEPPGGWRSKAVTTTDDAAVTILKASRREDALPPADLPLEVTGERFHVEGSPETAEGGLFGASGLEERRLRAGPRGLRAEVYLDVPRTGLYTLSTFGVAQGGQSWLADGCQKAVLCPDTRSIPTWRTVMTQELQAGPHSFVVTLAAGGAVERLRLERKKDTPGDYAATVRELGFDPGPDEYFSRTRALDAIPFIRQQRALLTERCGDVTLPEILTADLGGGAAGQAGGQQEGQEESQAPAPAQPVAPLPGTQLPPPSSTPAPGPPPGPTPLPGPTPPIPAPSPPPLPPPPTLPPQPPASPILPVP